MRIRSTKPEFWRSERIASVSWDARLLLKALESFVDDNGVGRDDIALIIGDLFQRDLIREPSRTVARVSEGISELHRAGLIHRYDADGTPVLYLSFWESAQRIDKPQPGRFPRPDGTLNYKDSIIREPSRILANAPPSLAPGTGEQGNRGTGEQGHDDTHLSETSHPGNRAREAEEMRELLNGEAERLGIPDTDMLVATLTPALGPIDVPEAIDVAREILTRAATMPRDSLAYVAIACREPDNVRAIHAQLQHPTGEAA
jgi:hypothetical protein